MATEFVDGRLILGEKPEKNPLSFKKKIENRQQFSSIKKMIGMEKSQSRIAEFKDEPTKSFIQLQDEGVEEPEVEEKELKPEEQ